MAKVSVIIPTYNCRDYLPKAISSVLDQTHRDIELLIINDNSSDDTAHYLTTLTDPRIIIMTAHGVGASKARNLGIQRSSGEFIAFLDADDFWYPDKLSLQLKLHKNKPDLALSFTNYDHFTERYQVIIDSFTYWEQFQNCTQESFTVENPLALVIKNNVIGTSTVMLRANVLSKVDLFDTNIRYGEDWELWLRICESHGVGVLNSVQSGYLMRQSSATQSYRFRLKNLQSIESILQRYEKESDRWNLSPSTLKSARARLMEGYADYHRGLHQNTTAISFGIAALILAPKVRRIRSLLGDCKSMFRFA
ncbi:glycosyltransferase family 2 protein [Vibrio genomosp. F10 str. 9ZC157]|uniref:Glycosyl transferase n=1 Tax=Vibrio genomosp. F10 str. ZF-129 TaxID=1187848 RepID=A0A1E5BGR0_9VIBR|nr:glycosyltransferase family A protein [Vibrio genomosp. F10]OEE35823.1 glycosyl transferase [Vibrio genomosp. F10 str. ZF-129]OEE97045.1 glycosyl transferase [Vibrio genomosp. F10 str. 9ZC157]